MEGLDSLALAHRRAMAVAENSEFVSHYETDKDAQRRATQLGAVALMARPQARSKNGVFALDGYLGTVRTARFSRTLAQKLLGR